MFRSYLLLVSAGSDNPFLNMVISSKCLRKQDKSSWTFWFRKGAFSTLSWFLQVEFVGPLIRRLAIKTPRWLPAVSSLKSWSAQLFGGWEMVADRLIWMKGGVKLRGAWRNPLTKDKLNLLRLPVFEAIFDMTDMTLGVQNGLRT